MSHAGTGAARPSAAGTKMATWSVSVFAEKINFGEVFAGTRVTRHVATVRNTGTSEVLLSPALTGSASFAIAGAKACGGTLAPRTACPVFVTFAPKAKADGTVQTTVLSFGLEGGTTVNLVAADVSAAGVGGTLTLTGAGVERPVGTVSYTGNPQVAQYSVTLPTAGSVTVEFGTTTAYGHQTSTKSITAAGTVDTLVAGMLPETLYHMRARVQLAQGRAANTRDANTRDATFVSGLPALRPGISAETTAGLTPQPGLEALTMFGGDTAGLVVTDLKGDVVWSYAPAQANGTFIQGAQQLENGDWLLGIGSNSSYPANGGTLPVNGLYAAREINLAGDTVREVTLAQLNAAVQTGGYNVQLLDIHHDILPLPNGHWIVLTNTKKAFTDLPGYPGITNVVGDVLVDVDPSGNVGWVWNAFDHLDVNRHPLNFPDWTHTNAVIYSPTDGNLIVSIRHQNWVVKVDYQNGAGSGNVLWHLGEGGDLELVGGNDPQDWEYAQHKPSLVTPNSAGVFSLGVMDNGNDREFAPGVMCGTVGNAPCQYTTIPVFEIDENAKTAKLTSHQILPMNLFSNFGGNTESLANGNTEYDLAGTAHSDIFEVTPGSTPQTVWHLRTSTSNAYRGFRIASMYPGVTY